MRKSLEVDILAELFKPMFRYKGISLNMLGLPSYRQNSKKVYGNAFRRLKDKEYIEYRGDFMFPTKKGKEYLKKKQNSLSIFSCPFKKDEPKVLLVMFDIPERNKAQRDWFRFQLKRFDYQMIQRSVWVGPSPLPKEFMEYLEEIKLKNCIKTFKLARAYKEKDV